MLFEALMFIGLVAAGLLLAGLLVLVAEALAVYSEPLGGSPLAIVALGGFAALLLALTLLFWFRGRQGARDEGGIRQEDPLAESMRRRP